MEVGACAEEGEGLFVDDGGGGVDGGAFREGEEVLDVVVGVLEGGVGPGEDAAEGAALGVGGWGGRGVEADGEGEGWGVVFGGGGSHAASILVV